MPLINLGVLDGVNNHAKKDIPKRNKIIKRNRTNKKKENFATNVFEFIKSLSPYVDIFAENLLKGDKNKLLIYILYCIKKDKH